MSKVTPEERSYREAVDKMDMGHIEMLANRMRLRRTMPKHIVDSLQTAIDDYNDWYSDE